VSPKESPTLSRATAPMKFPVGSYFGSKAKVVDVSWKRLGNPGLYIEPFAGSLATLLGRPSMPDRETVNDASGFVVNFWRAMKAEPMQLARCVDWPLLEADLWARRRYLVEHRAGLEEKLGTDPHFYDVTLAGYWAWTLSASIAPRLTADRGKPTGWKGLHARSLTLPEILRWFDWLSVRLRKVRVLQGDYRRTLTNAELSICESDRLDAIGIFLDPPYSTSDDNNNELYGTKEKGISIGVREWAIEHGGDRRFRIILCGSEGEHKMPRGWESFKWQRSGMFRVRGEEGDLKTREEMWFSPGCLKV
jgi:DNA adenine methylase